MEGGLGIAAALGALTLGVSLACGGKSSNTPANQPPAATNAAFNNGGAPFNSARSLNLLALTQAVDPEGDAITFRLNRTVSGADIGALVVSGAAATFTPFVGVEGTAVFELVAVDAKGATSSPVSLTISLVDTRAPLLGDPGYDTTAPTNHDVTASIASSEPEDIPAPSGWSRAGTSGNWTYARTYNANIAGDPFVLTDRAGNASTRMITIANIDKVGPAVEEPVYSTTSATNQDVTATLRAAENLAAPAGWTKGTDGGTGRFPYTKVYADNATETVSFVDAAGNRTDKVVRIDWIDKTAPGVITFEAATIGFDSINYHVVASENGKAYLWFVAAPPAQDPSAAEVVQQATTDDTMLALVKDQVANFTRTGLAPSTSYTLYLVAEDALGNRSSVRRFDARTAMPADHPSAVAAPGFVDVTATSLTVVNAIEDSDGIRNITYSLYSDATAATLVGTNATGRFTALTPNTPYWARTAAETLNANTGIWTAQASGLSAVTTTQTLPAAPVPTMTAASDSGSSSADRYTNLDPVITWTAVATATGYERSVDGEAYTDLGNVLATTVGSLPDGAHLIAIRAKNAAGSGNAATLNVTIDRVAQGVPAPGNLGSVATGTPTWTWSAVAGATFYVVSLDGGAEVPVATASFTPASALADGAHAITVKSVDLAGNTSAASPAATVTVLNPLPAAPAATMTAASDSGSSDSDHYTNLDPVLTWTAVATASGYERSLDGMAYTDLGNVLTTTVAGLADGTHTIDIRARNGAGSGAASTITVTIDKHPQAVPSPGNLGTVTTSVPTWTWSAVPGATSYLVSLDGDAEVPVAAASFTPSSALADGAHGITVKSVDLAGNASAASPAATATVATNLPADLGVTFDATTDSGQFDNDNLTNASMRFTFVIGANTTDIQRNVDGVGWTSVGTGGSNTIAAGALADGTHTIEYRAMKGTNPQAGTPIAYTITFDSVLADEPFTVAPTVQGQAYADVQLTGEKLWKITSANGGAVGAVSYSGGVNHFSYTAPNTASDTLTLYDVAGNTRNKVFALAGLPAAPTGLTLTNDTGISSTDRITNDVHVGWNAAASATGYDVSIDGTTWTDVGNVTTLDAKTALGLGDGAFTFQVRARNAAGAGTAASLSFTLDTAAPGAVTWSGVVPSAQGTAYAGLVLANASHDIAKLVSLTDSTGGTLANASLTGGDIHFDWTTPGATPGTLFAVYQDTAGNPRSTTLNVALALAGTASTAGGSAPSR